MSDGLGEENDRCVFPPSILWYFKRHRCIVSQSDKLLLSIPVRWENKQNFLGWYMKPAAGIHRFASMAELLLPRQHHRFLFISCISDLHAQCPLRHCPLGQDLHVDSSAPLSLGVLIFHPLLV